jgi:serine/threonine protein kinase
MLQCYDHAPSWRSIPLHTEPAGAAPFDTFGPFRVLHQIAAGTLGPVFRAYDPDHDRLVAVKLFQFQDDLGPDRVRQLLDGLQRLVDADLAHPAISTPVAAGMVGASAYLAQDFVAAKSLDVVVRDRGAMALVDVVGVASQLSGALDFAAASGVYHGALHPRDILLASDDARLTGLGVAQILDRLGVPPAFHPPYTAPERLAGKPWDRRADVFSLAVVTFEMLTGRPPIGAGTKAAAELPDITDDPPALRRAFAIALADRAEDRFHTAQAFADALGALVRSGAVDRAAVTATAVQAMSRPERGPSLPLRAPGVEICETLQAGEMSLPGDVPSGRDVDPDWEIHLAPEPVPQALIDTSEVLHLPAFPSAPPPADRVGLPEPSAAPRMNPDGDATHSAVWPLALALTVGLIVGVAVGFFVFAERGGALPGAETAEAAALVPRSAGGNPGSVVGLAPAPGPPPAAPPGASTAIAPAAPQAPAPVAPDRVAEGAEGVAPPPSRPVVSPRSPQPDGVAAPSVARAIERPRAASPEASRRTAAVGRLLVRSSPAGARVWFDDRDVGTTPVTLRSLPFGVHTLRLTREGYESESSRVIISAEQPAQSVIVDLDRGREPVSAGVPDSRLTASLTVESRPAGASVYLDGRRMGTTPLVLDAAPTGPHALRLELDGYRRWTSSIRLAAGESNRVTASLEQ